MKRIYLMHILLLSLVEFGIIKGSIESLCDESKNCGSNISATLCEKRNCCFIPSTSRSYQCVQKRNANSMANLSNQPYHRPQYEEAKIRPPDAMESPQRLNEDLNKLKLTGKDSLLPSQTMQITNWFDDYLKLAASTGSPYFNWKYSQGKLIHVEIKRDPSTYEKLVRFESGTTIQVELTGNNMWSEIIALIFVEYLTVGKSNQTLEKRPDETIHDVVQKCLRRKHITESAAVVSVKAYDKQWEERPISFKFYIDQLKNLENEDEKKKFSCEFLNESSAQWSSNGCELIDGSCRCNDTRKFSAVFIKKSFSLETPVIENTDDVQVVEFIMEAISFGCLVLTLLILIFILRRRSKSYTSASARIKERTHIHINFVAAMTALHMTKIISETIHENAVMCAAAVVFGRYFMLVSAMWMLIESFILHVNVIAKGLKPTNMACYKFIAGWIIPAVIALATAAVGFSSGSYIETKDPDVICNDAEVSIEKALPVELIADHCWLSVEKNVLWSAAGPLIGIFVINLFILTHTVVFVLWLSAKSEISKSKKRKSQNIQHIWHATKGILVLFPILGIPWLVDFYVTISAFRVHLTVQYIHVFLNGLQGFALFILYCGMNKEAQSTFQKVASNTWKHQKISHSRSGNGCSASLKERFRKNNNNNIRIGYNYHPPLQRSKFSKSINQMMADPRNFNPYYNVLQRPPSASFSTNASFPHFKTKRNYSVTPGDAVNGSPQVKCFRSPPELFGSGNLKTPHHESRPSVLPGVSPQPGDPAMISFSFEDASKEQTFSPAFKTRWRHMSVQDFPRFSVIPEELRRDVDIESLVVENNNSKELLHGKLKRLGNRETVEVDVHMNVNKISLSPRNNKFLTNIERSRASSKRGPSKTTGSGRLKNRFGLDAKRLVVAEQKRFNDT